MIPPLRGRHLSEYLRSEPAAAHYFFRRKNYMHGPSDFQSEALFKVLMTLRQNIASLGLMLFIEGASLLTANTIRDAMALGAPMPRHPT